MNIKFLYEGTTQSEPVVPSFIPWKTNIFIGLHTFKEYTSACALMKNIDIDNVADQFKAEFSSVPPRLIDHVIRETAVVAGRLPNDKAILYWARTDESSAALARRGHEEVKAIPVFTIKKLTDYM